MITSIPVEAIEKQLLQQLSSFFFLSEEDKMLINIKMGGFLVVSIVFPARKTSIIHVMARPTSILIKAHNIQFFSISFPTPFLKKPATVCWLISCII